MKIVKQRQRQQISSPSLEELHSSHYILEAFITALPSHTRKELAGLLQTLSKGGLSQELSDSIRQRALQIVSGICKPDLPQEQVLVETASQKYQKRQNERRQRDRRQRQPVNSGKPWTTEQEQILRVLAEQNTPIRRIALRLGRTSTAVQSKAKEINLPLNPIKVSG